MGKRGLFFLLVFVIFVVGCTKVEEKKESEGVYRLTLNDLALKTEDGIRIAADHYVNSGEKGVILLHMFGRDRGSWTDFAQYLQSNSYDVLAIDFRGHGRSDLKYTDFKEEDFNKMVLDVKAAKKYFTDKGINNIAVIGASIGANTALNYGLTDKDVKALVLLSPGENYKGIKIQEDLTKLVIPILIAVSEGDSSSLNSGLRIMDSTNAKKSIKIYKNSDAHGIDMFEKTDLKLVILDWLNKNI